jgi:DNA-binding protein H-NS
MAKDLDRMSYKELQDLELRLRRAKASAQERARSEVRQKAESIITAAGFRVSDVFGGRGGKGRTVAAKYVNPDDPSQTWTGRGRKPRWLAAKLKEGERMEKFLIK